MREKTIKDLIIKQCLLADVNLYYKELNNENKRILIDYILEELVFYEMRQKKEIKESMKILKCIIPSINFNLLLNTYSNSIECQIYFLDKVKQSILELKKRQNSNIEDKKKEKLWKKF